jgi:protein-L-isoaspartate(D-aspartate) O-methyltransferase
MDSTITADLRAKLVDELRQRNFIETQPVADAFLRVPREAFVPFVRQSELYRNVVIATRWDRQGRSRSSSSEPGIMARMLEMLRIEAGQNVLEIGAATGYNAALLSELVGDDGHVTSVEVQPDLAEEARRHLLSAGYTDVEVLAADGRLGHAARAPFDRIIGTASAGEVSMAWWDHLRPDGLLVLPYRWNNAQAVFALRRTMQGFETERATIGGFMPMHGPQGRPAEWRPLGPRQDVAVSPARLPKNVEPGAFFTLLLEAPREDQPPALGTIFSTSEGGSDAWRVWWDFACFLATRVELLLSLGSRNDIYGFRNALAIADTSVPSLALLASSGPPPLPGQPPSPCRLLGFGAPDTYDRLVQVAEEYVALGRPRVERLRMALMRTPAGRQWKRSFTYAPATD